MRSPARSDDSSNDEETPLLSAQSDDTPLKPSPFPTIQISVLVLPWIAETVMTYSISPYINQLIGDLPIVGGDVRKVGYYTGIIASLHFAAEGLTTLHWSRLSDRIGRKPVLLSCLAGTIVSMFLFGLSRSFWAILLSRFLHGTLKGNFGVVKSAVAELTDEANQARGFSVLLLTWALGSVIGPLIGGNLSRPHDRWPHLFSHSLWVEYPYFLPCLVVAVYSCVSWVVVALFLKESLVRTPPPVKINPDITQEVSSGTMDTSQKDTQMPPPLRSLLTRPVLITVANYSALSLLEMTAVALIPLIWSTPVEFGGLDLSPASIGLGMSLCGFMGGIFQFAVFPCLVARFGLRWVLATSVAICAVIFAMFPLENLVMRHAIGGRPNATLWLLIFLQLWSLSIHKMGFGAVFMYVSSATPPNRRSLGAVNGFAQSVAAVQRTIGPAAADSLFAFSVTKNVWGGNFIYVVLLSIVCVGLSIAAQLPRHMWTHGGG